MWSQLSSVLLNSFVCRVIRNWLMRLFSNPTHFISRFLLNFSLSCCLGAVNWTFTYIFSDMVKIIELFYQICLIIFYHTCSYENFVISGVELWMYKWIINIHKLVPQQRNSNRLHSLFWIEIVSYCFNLRKSSYTGRHPDYYFLHVAFV